VKVPYSMQMLARRALLCTLMFGGAIAHADRRSVAVIETTADTANPGGNPKTVNLARELNAVLLGHPELQPLVDQKLAAELYGEFQNDDVTVIENARNTLQTAEDFLSRYEFGAALEGTNRAQAALHGIVPTPGAMRLYAQIAFVKAQALLGSPSRALEAPAAFALSNRIDPSFIPDAARYLPDVVQAFDAAKRRWTGKAMVTIAGTGKLWVDGREVTGMPLAPAELELDAGPHVIWLTGDDRVPIGKQILVDAGKKSRVEIPDVSVDIVLKVRRARADLRSAQDPTAKANAMKKLAELLSGDTPVRDAVLLSIANGKIIYQTWNAGTREKAPGFSALRELKSEKPIDLLSPLSPPKPKAEEKVFTFDKPVVDSRRWYERRTWQATMAVGAIATIITGYYIYKGLTDDDFDVTGVGLAARGRTSPLSVSF
jgi:hypothetical protein